MIGQFADFDNCFQKNDTFRAVGFVCDSLVDVLNHPRYPSNYTCNLPSNYAFMNVFKVEKVTPRTTDLVMIKMYRAYSHPLDADIPAKLVSVCKDYRAKGNRTTSYSAYAKMRNAEFLKKYDLESAIPAKCFEKVRFCWETRTLVVVE